MPRNPDSMDAAKDPPPVRRERPAGENPTDPDLDVEGPNESAPGHEPRPEGQRTEEESTPERG